MKSKFKEYSLILLLVLLAGFNNFNKDYYAYKQIFYLTNKNSNYYVERLFQYLIKVFYFFSNNYDYFLFTVVFLSFIFMQMGIKKIKGMYYVYYFYILYPFLYDYVQIRFFLAQSLLILSLSYLSKNNKKSIVLLVISILIHTSIIFWTIYYIIYFCVKNKNINNYYVLYIIFFLCSLFLKEEIMKLLVFLVKNPLIEYKIKNYIFYKSARFIGVYINIILILNLYLCKLCLRKKIKNKNIVLEKIMKSLNIFVLIILPLINFNIEFLRILRPGIIIYYIYYIYFFKNYYNSFFKKRLLISLIFCYAMFYILNINNLYLELLKDLLLNNRLLK